MMNDQMTTLMEKTRKKIDKQVIVYCSKKLSQKELRKLVPSLEEG
jgi:GH25 family lysozyme M1 (1,4-beta-N-acetylmuramidase)